MREFSNLRTMVVDVLDVISEAYSRPGWRLTAGKRDSAIHPRQDQLELFLQHCFPATLETLFLTTHRHLTENHADETDMAFATMVNSGRYSSLQAIFMSSLKFSSADINRGESPSSKTRTKFWFSETTAAGFKHDVYVHTRSGLSHRRREFGLPMGYGDEDLKTGPYTQAPGSLVYESDTGVISETFCANCGACKFCRSYYHPKVWAQRKTPPAGQRKLDVWAKAPRGLLVPVV